MGFDARKKIQPMIYYYVGFYLGFISTRHLLTIEGLNVECCCEVRHVNTHTVGNTTLGKFFQCYVMVCLSDSLSVCLPTFVPRKEKYVLIIMETYSYLHCNFLLKTVKIIFLIHSLNTFAVRRKVNHISKQICQHHEFPKKFKIMP